MAAALIAVVVLAALGGAAPAWASPNLVIESPAAGTSHSTVTFSGTSTDTTDQVAVNVYAGKSAAGKAVQTVTASPSEAGAWSAKAESLSPDGAYTAVAEQTGLEGTLTSAPVTFTIDTVAPEVTIEAVPSPSADQTPTLEGGTGTAVGDEPAVTVKIYKGTSISGALVTSGSAVLGSGSWTFKSPELADGTYTAQASQSDEAGNVGHSLARTFTVKTAAPVVTMHSVPSPGNNATPTLEGSAGAAEADEPEVKVTIFKGASVGGSIANTGSAGVTGGSWTYPAPHLADGTYTAQATQRDKAGNTGASAPQTFTIDTVAPAVTMNSIPSPTSDATPTLEGIAGTAEGDEAAVNVKIYKGSSVGGSIASSGAALVSGGSWTYTPSHLSDGTYTAQATQEDAAGNVGKSTPPVTFTVKAGKPVVTLSQPASPSNNSSPTLSGTADTTEGDIQSVTVRVYSGGEVSGTPVRTVTAGVSSGSWNAGPIELADGTYTAQAEQKDEAGNAGTSAARTFVIDTKAPIVSTSQPASPTKDSTPTLKGARGTAPGDIAAVSVIVYHGGSVGGAVASSGAASVSGGSWSYTSSTLAEGTYTAQTTQEDAAGNVGKSNAVTLTVKIATPIVTLEQPAPLSNSSPALSGTADTAEGDIQSITVNVYSGAEVAGSPVRTVTVGASAGKWSAGPIELPEGTFTAQAEQSDEAGNTGTSAPRTFTIDRAPPNITLSQPASPTNNATPTLKGTRGTASKDSSTVSVAVFAGSSPTGTVVASNSFAVGGSAWSYTTPHLSDGTYTAQATQGDEAGNVGKSAAVTFTIDTVAPEVTLDPIASPTNNPTPKLAGTAGSAPGDSATVNVTIYEGSEAGAGAVAVFGTATRSGGTWSFTPKQALADGTYTAQVTQKDQAGNVGTSAEHTFTVNTAPPTVTMSSPAPLSNNTTPSFSGTASDTTPVTVKIYKGKAASGTPKAEASASVVGGNWSSSAASPALEDGTYTAVASQPSSLGNAEGKSASATFTVASHAPTVTLNQPPSPSKNTAPTFSGTASDTTPVTVRIYEGEHPSGKVVSETTGTPSGEAWSSTPASPALQTGSHTYTAVAYEKSSLSGNPEGTSVPVTFAVDTNAPTVTLNPQAKARSNNARPTFAGSATDTTAVTVNIYKGKTATGAVVTSATGVPAAGAWASGPTAATLADGEYTAQATQPSSIENPAGTSAPSTFIIDTKPPAVSIKALKAQLNNPMPELTGNVGTEAGDIPKVLVKIYKGATVGPEVAAEGEATITTAGKVSSWSFKPTAGSLADGTYTAQATQTDEAGNAGAATLTAPFTIDTIAPTVVLNVPALRSNNTKPTFTGTASELTPVVVSIYASATATAKVAEATAKGTGTTWTSGAAVLPIAKGKSTYWASATQTDEAGNTTTTAPRVKFVVDTEAPTVTINPPARTNNRSPSFSGTASDPPPATVTIDVYSPGQQPTTGACEKPGTPIAVASANGTGAGWASSAISRALPDGSYVVIASQTSAFGNHCAETPATPLTIDTIAPHVSIDTPASGSAIGGELLTTGGSAGTSEGDLPSVTVSLYAGETIAPGQAPVSVRPVGVSRGRWSETFANLPPGAYTARAEQLDEAGNLGLSGAPVFHLVGTRAAPGSPAASFSWYPLAPHAGEAVSLVSSSTDATSPLKAFAWDLAGNGPFQPGGQVLSTSFATAGNHVVRLRVTDASGASSVATETIPVGAPQAPLMQPFPLVRVVSTRTSSGVRLHLLSILASRGARIVITCKGRACPVKRQSKVASARRAGLVSVSFPRFERALPSGTTLEIRVYKPGSVGKYTRLSIRGGSVHRLDECLATDGIKPIPCPSS